MFENEVFSGTDLELERRVTSYLAQRNMYSLRAIRVAAKNGTIVLTGKVQTFYERQICLSCCQHVAGVLSLVDQIEVAA